MKQRVEEILDFFFRERSDLFLIHLSVSLQQDISVIIDGDKGVSIKDCIDLSRRIESTLALEQDDSFDFSLKVLSAGLMESLKDIRQYRKNIGLNLNITLNEGRMVTGKLSKVDDETICIEYKTREPKPVGKGKVTVTKIEEISYKKIKQAQVKINFNT